jgi:hypothetical protein
MMTDLAATAQAVLLEVVLVVTAPLRVVAVEVLLPEHLVVELEDILHLLILKMINI